MQWGWSATEKEAFAVMDAFAEAGGTFLDTADVYSNWVEGNRGGVAEEIIGRWMKKDQPSMIFHHPPRKRRLIARRGAYKNV